MKANAYPRWRIWLADGDERSYAYAYGRDAIEAAQDAFNAVVPYRQAFSDVALCARRDDGFETRVTVSVGGFRDELTDMNFREAA